MYYKGWSSSKKLFALILKTVDIDFPDKGVIIRDPYYGGEFIFILNLFCYKINCLGSLHVTLRI